MALVTQTVSGGNTPPALPSPAVGDVLNLTVNFTSVGAASSVIFQPQQGAGLSLVDEQAVDATTRATWLRGAPSASRPRWT